MTRVLHNIHFHTATELYEALGELINMAPSIRHIECHGFHLHGMVQLVQRRPYDGQLIYDIHLLEDPDVDGP